MEGPSPQVQERPYPNGWFFLSLSIIAYGGAAWLAGSIGRPMGVDRQKVVTIGLVLGVANGTGYCIFEGCSW